MRSDELRKRRELTQRQVPGHERRALIRGVIGKPGSIRRWLLANLVALPLAIASMNFYLIVSVVLLSTMWIMYLRTMIVDGDEDEMRAWLRWQSSRKNPDRPVLSDDEKPVIDSTDWLHGRHDTFLDVPPPPVVEQMDEAQDDDDAVPRGV